MLKIRRLCHKGQTADRQATCSGVCYRTPEIVFEEVLRSLRWSPKRVWGPAILNDSWRSGVRLNGCLTHTYYDATFTIYVLSYVHHDLHQTWHVSTWLLRRVLQANRRRLLSPGTWSHLGMLCSGVRNCFCGKYFITLPFNPFWTMTLDNGLVLLRCLCNI